MAKVYKKKHYTLDPKTKKQRVFISRNWYVQYRDVDGTLKRKALIADKQLAQKMADDLVYQVERQKAGFNDEEDFAAVRRPIIEYFTEFENHLSAKGDTNDHIQKTLNMVKTVGRESNWHFIADMKTVDAEKFLNKILYVQNLSHNRANAYIRAIKSFGNWLVESNKLAKSPFKSLKLLNAAVDKRHSRRALSMDEFQRLVDTAQSGPPIQNISGIDRAMLYALAAWTGFRKGELGSLTRSQIFLDAPNPYISIQAAYSKRRRNDVQYLHAGLVEPLHRWLEQKDPLPNEILFPISKVAGGTDRQTSKMIEKDMACARDFWLAESKTPEERAEREQSDFLKYQDSQGNFADFHGLRHTFRAVPKTVFFISIFF